MNEETLITLVQENECLYNSQHREYDNHLVKDNAWTEIAEKLHSTIDETKSRWAMLRAYYRRALNRRKTVTGQSTKIIRKWRYEDQMQFLKRHLHERETQSNLTYDDEREENNNDAAESENLDTPSVASSSGVIKRNKKSDSCHLTLSQTLDNFIASRQKSESDDVPSPKKRLMTFFEDISETMSKFPKIDQAEIKRDIFTLVNEKELELLRQASTRHQTI